MKVKELFKIRKGKKANTEIDDYQDGAVRYIQIEDLRSNDNIKYCKLDDDVILAKENDIILTWDGANAGTSHYNLKGAIGSTLARLRPKREDFFLPYVGLYIKSKQQYLRDKCTGATIPHVDRKVLQNIEVPLPPYELQEKIVSILDKADSLRQKRRQSIEKLDTLTQSVFLEMFGDPIRESTYPTQELKELVAIKGGGTPSKKRPEYFGEDIPWVTPKDMKSLILNDSKIKITNEGLENSSAKVIEPFSVIAVVRSGILKRTWPLGINDRQITINQDMKAFKCGDKLRPFYLLYFLKLYSRKILGTVRGTTADNISSSSLYSIPVMIPSLGKQDEFVETVKKVQQVKNEFKVSNSFLDNLFNSLLQKAFKGELHFGETEAPLMAAEPASEYEA